MTIITTGFKIPGQKKHTAYCVTYVQLHLIRVLILYLYNFMEIQILPKHTGESDMAEISKYLGGMTTPNILYLGTILGLNYIKLKNNMKSETFLLDTIYSWLQKEDNVANTGNPTWRTLVDALISKGVGQTGIADQIAKDKNIS